jgi:hypothetical protein
LLLTAVFCLAGCGRWEREERAVLERAAAGRLHKSLWLHEAQFPDHPRTNLTTVFQELGVEYPSDLHEKFRRYGREAGFTNSIFERYLFTPGGISNEVLKGEIILMGAKPYVNEGERLVRIALVRNGPGYEGWSFNEFNEDQVQQSFKDAGVEMPPPRPPVASAPIAREGFQPRVSFAAKVRRFFQNVAYYYGPGRFFWFPMMLICIGSVLFVVILLIIWFTRRSRRS